MTRGHWLRQEAEMMRCNMQREGTESKFGPGLTMFGLCCGILLLLPRQKGWKQVWDTELKKQKKWLSLQITAMLSQCVNVTLNDVNMSWLQGRYRCFWCLLSVSVLSEDDDNDIWHLLWNVALVALVAFVQYLEGGKQRCHLVSWPARQSTTEVTSQRVRLASR